MGFTGFILIVMSGAALACGLAGVTIRLIERRLIAVPTARPVRRGGR
jgi:hypothetical protein